MLVLLLVHFLFASISIESKSDLEGHKNIKVVCSGKEALCYDICDDKNQCIVKESSCNNCLSTYNQGLRSFFAMLGSSFRTDYQALNREELASYLSNNHFVTWSYDSHQNDSEYKGLYTRLRFDELCQAKDGLISKPLIFDLLDKQKRFSFWQEKIVVCQYKEIGLKAYLLKYRG